MKAKLYLPYKSIFFIWMVMLGILVAFPNKVKAQEAARFGVSVQGGVNLFLSDAYPEDIMSGSFAATFDYQPYYWVGFMFKAENGTLKGTKKYASGNIPYSAETHYTMLTPLFYVHATNIVFGVDEDRWVDIKVVGGGGITIAKYNVNYTNPAQPSREGTSNIPTLTAGGIMEFHVAPKLTFLLELNGIADFTNSLDGIWDENQGAAAYKGYDVVATFEAGLKYRFGGDVSYSGGKKKKAKYIYEPKSLPSQYKEYKGADGMERSRGPKY